MIGYFVIVCIAALDFYYHMYVNKKKKTFIYTPFDYISGYYEASFEEKQEQEIVEMKKVKKIN